MTSVQLLIAASGVFVTLLVALIGALWGITERNTSRLIDSFEKRMTENAAMMERRMNERDEKLLAKIDAVATKVDGLRAETASKIDAVSIKMDALRAETLAKFETVQVQLDELKKQGAERVFLEKQVTTLTARVDMLERRAA